jgi:hypothetical protein
MLHVGVLMALKVASTAELAACFNSNNLWVNLRMLKVSPIIHGRRCGSRNPCLSAHLQTPNSQVA